MRGTFFARPRICSERCLFRRFLSLRQINSRNLSEVHIYMHLRCLCTCCHDFGFVAPQKKKGDFCCRSNFDTSYFCTSLLFLFRRRAPLFFSAPPTKPSLRSGSLVVSARAGALTLRSCLYQSFYFTLIL